MSPTSPDSSKSPQVDALKPIMPPKILAAALVAQAAFHAVLPGPQLFSGAVNAAGFVLLVAGVAMVLSVARVLARASTTIKPLQVSDQLVTTGLFEYSRNPIYLGMVTLLLGSALFWGTLTPLLIVPIFPWWISRNIIVHEERMLEERFGDAYTSYQQRVRRWI